jgi:hypothetical protein
MGRFATRQELQNVAGGVPEAPIDGTAYARKNAAWNAVVAGGDALVANNLDQFASVTQTAGKTLAITDNTTLNGGTVNGGTHSGTNTGDQTNITGNAATVTTNANLTGPVTSVGNATTIADAELAALAGLTSAADKGIQFTGAGTAATFDLTTAGKALLDDADATAQRATLGLGTAATTSSAAYEAAGSIATHAALTTTHGISAFGATLVDDANAAAARTTLALGTAAVAATGDFEAAGSIATHAALPNAHHNRSHSMTGGSDHSAGNWKLFYSDGAGAVTELPLGADYEVLSANGTSAAPNFGPLILENRTSDPGGAVNGQMWLRVDL